MGSLQYLHFALMIAPSSLLALSASPRLPRPAGISGSRICTVRLCLPPGIRARLRQHCRRGRGGVWRGYSSLTPLASKQGGIDTLHFGSLFLINLPHLFVLLLC